MKKFNYESLYNQKLYAYFEREKKPLALFILLSQPGQIVCC